MKNTSSIKKNYQFKNLYHRGQSQTTPFFAMYRQKNKRAEEQNENFLGITVGVKLGNAVVRNKVRRRISAIYRLEEAQIKTGFSIVIVARNRCATASYQQMEKSMMLLLDQLDLHKNPKNPVKYFHAGSGGKKNSSQNQRKYKPTGKAEKSKQSHEKANPNTANKKEKQLEEKELV